MKIFITGGSGYVGSILANSLSSKFSITVGSQKKIFKVNQIKKMKYKVINYKSAESLKFFFKDFDAVIHLVGMNKIECEKNKDKSLLFKERVTTNILKACIHNNIKKLIYLSSSQVYKNFQNRLVNEKSKIDNENFYSRSHLLAEKLILKRDLVNYTIVRASNIFGFIKVDKLGEQKKNLVHKLCEEAFKYKTITLQNPNTIKNFLPTSILALNIIQILKSNKFDQRIINVGYKSMSLYSLALKIKNRFKTLKDQKIKILKGKNLKSQKNFHKYSSLFNRFKYAQKEFIVEIDNIINLLIKKKFKKT